MLQYLTRSSVSRYTGNKGSGNEEPQRWYERQGADSAKPTGGLAQLCFLPAANAQHCLVLRFKSTFFNKREEGKGTVPTPHSHDVHMRH